jgi:hypothetical protein
VSWLHSPTIRRRPITVLARQTWSSSLPHTHQVLGVIPISQRIRATNRVNTTVAKNIFPRLTVPMLDKRHYSHSVPACLAELFVCRVGVRQRAHRNRTCGRAAAHRGTPYQSHQGTVSTEILRRRPGRRAIYRLADIAVGQDCLQMVLRFRSPAHASHSGRVRDSTFESEK